MAAIHYEDGDEHTATAAEHIEAIGAILKEFIKNNTPQDIATASDCLTWHAEALDVLNEKPKAEKVTLTWTDWGGFIIK